MPDLFKKTGSGGSLRKLIGQFVKFGIVGVSNTAIFLAIYYAFVCINKDWYILGNTVGFAVSVLNAYYWNNKYVFRKTKKGTAKPLLKTYISYGSTFLLGTAALYLMVHDLHVSEFWAPIINLAITTPINFLLNRFWALS